MNTPSQISPVVDRLEQILDAGDIQAPYDRWGARLLAHLTKPVQVVVTGLDGSGKSTLVEMMAAQPVLGTRLRVPVTELVYGEHPRALIEREDGSITEVAGYLKDCDCPEDAIRARQELPDTSLIRQNFVEINLSGDLSQKAAMMEVVTARADIILWCSQEFSDEEQQLWAGVPDQLKDHSFLVLTMADRQLMRGTLSSNINRLGEVVADEFMGLYPVATIQGITAQTAGESVDQVLWTSSGGKQLMDPVLKQIKQGRTADIDQAQIFMDRLATQTPKSYLDVTPPSPDLVVQPAEPTPPVPDIAETAAPEVEDARTARLLSDAIDLLQGHAGQMLDDVDKDGDLDADAILSRCSEALTSLAGLLDEGEVDDPTARAVRDDVQDGGEMLMLFQLERGEEAALDAVTLLLQMRKELIDQVAS